MVPVGDTHRAGGSGLDHLADVLPAELLADGLELSLELSLISGHLMPLFLFYTEDEDFDLPGMTAIPATDGVVLERMTPMDIGARSDERLHLCPVLGVVGLG